MKEYLWKTSLVLVALIVLWQSIIVALIEPRFYMVKEMMVYEFITLFATGCWVYGLVRSVDK